jgi:predicted RND superfamily exporter protein
MTLSVTTWLFSDLKFQADMGLLLAFMFLVNMFAAILVLPALAAFLVGDRMRGKH